ncbi:hypothetical protein RYX36_031831 [Vicia faba]
MRNSSLSPITISTVLRESTPRVENCDREGDKIAFEDVDVCTAVNPPLTIKMAQISALVPNEIHESVQNLVEPNNWFSDAVDVRQEIDLHIGASFTKF